MGMKDIAYRYLNRIPVCKEMIYRYRYSKMMRFQLDDTEIKACESNVSRKRALVERLAKRDQLFFLKLEEKYKELLNMFQMRLESVDPVWLKLDVFFCCAAYGVVPYEYMMFDFLHCDYEDRKTFLTEYNRYQYYFKMNDPYKEQVLFDKYKTALMYHDFFGREYLKVSQSCTEEMFLKFVERHPVFVEKPCNQSRGDGVKKVFAQQINTADYYTDIYKKGTIILEEAIEQDDKMGVLHTQSVNTVRCTTITNRQGVHLFHPVLRMGQGRSFVDNASAGGIIANIDTDSGVVYTNGYDEAGNEYAVHPDSGQMIKGFQIPQWEELKKVASSIGNVLPDVGYVGWDLALSKKGWIMIEGNPHGQFLCEYVERKGFKREMDHYLSQI